MFTDDQWKKYRPQFTEEDIVELVENALSRVAVVLNSKILYQNNWKDILEKRNEEVRFAAKGLVKISREVLVNVDSKEGNDSYFYPAVWISQSGDRKIIHYRITDSFIQAAIKGAQVNREFFLSELQKEARDPDVEPLENEKAEDYFPRFFKSCYTNYFVKNIWHNMVHTTKQNITHKNFHNFGGLSREMSDFQADNLATLFLCVSYGIPLVCSPRTITHRHKHQIISLLKRNRISQMFRIREESRSKSHQEPDPAEQEWVYFRRTLNFLSGWLVAEGLAPGQLEIYRTRSGEGPKAEEISINVNGVFYHVPMEPFVHVDRQDENCSEFNRTHYQRIAHFLSVVVDAQMMKKEGYQSYSESLLGLICEQFGVSEAAVFRRPKSVPAGKKAV